VNEGQLGIVLVTLVGILLGVGFGNILQLELNGSNLLKTSQASALEELNSKNEERNATCDAPKVQITLSFMES